MKLYKHIITGALALSISSLAAAEAYVGGALGSTDVDQSGFDTSDTFKVYGGYRAGNIGIEGAYLNFDRFDVQGSGGAEYVDGNGLEVSAIGFLPLSQNVELFGKLGLLSWSLDANAFGSTFGSDDGTSFAYGAGIQFKPAEQVSLRLEYQGFNDVSDADLSSFFVGAAVHF